MELYGRPFEIARSNYVVTNYHTELLQMIIALDLANLNILSHSLTFDDSCSSLEIKCYRTVYRLSFKFRVSATCLHKLLSCWLILSKEWLFVLAFADFRSTCVDFSLLFDTYR